MGRTYSTADDTEFTDDEAAAIVRAAAELRGVSVAQLIAETRAKYLTDPDNLPKGFAPVGTCSTCGQQVCGCDAGRVKCACNFGVVHEVEGGCGPNAHAFDDDPDLVRFADALPEHPAAKAGHFSWIVCRRCSAWAAHTEESVERIASCVLCDDEGMVPR